MSLSATRTDLALFRRPNLASLEGSNFIVVVIGDKAVLGINQNPAELRRRSRGTVDDTFSDSSARKSIYEAKKVQSGGQADLLFVALW